MPAAPRILLISVPGLRQEDLGRMPALAAIAASGSSTPLAPCLPALTCPVQATLTTGTPPAVHGIAANGVFDRSSRHLEMWISPDSVHRAPRLWDRLAAARPDLRTAAWFLLQSKHAGADLVCLPAPRHNTDGTETMWCHTRPEGLYTSLRERFGDFPLHSFWGPVAGIESSRWIVRSFLAAAADAPPHCACIYLPHLDYAAQRTGPDSPPALAACGELDAEIDFLVSGFRALVDPDEVVVIVAGEYRIRPVSHAIFPNRILRRAGLLGISSTADGELLDIPASRAWALADHQVGHIFLHDGGDRGLIDEIRALFQGRAGVGQVLTGPELVEAGLAAASTSDVSSRCGDLVVTSALDSWQAYPYWLDDDRAPGFARTIDIHRKPGYDPLELHLDRTRLPTIAIPLDTALVKGSHGALDPAAPHETILITSRPGLVSGPLAMHEVAGIVLDLFGVASP